MNCEFCGSNLKLSHYENNKETAVYDCIDCPVLISFSYFLGDQKAGEPVRTKTSYMIDRHGKCYVWSNNYIKGNSYITDISESGLDKALSGRSPLLITFPKLMNINPTNIHEKLSFYLTFL